MGADPFGLITTNLNQSRVVAELFRGALPCLTRCYGSRFSVASLSPQRSA